jgi:hypothetical protein
MLLHDTVWIEESQRFLCKLNSITAQKIHNQAHGNQVVSLVVAQREIVRSK